MIQMMRRIWRIVLCTLWLASAFAAPKVYLGAPLRVDRDDRSIPEPKSHEVSEMYAIVYNSWLRHISPPHKISGAMDSRALNVNAWDEVPDSSWFANRMGRAPIPYDRIASTLAGNEPEPGAWKIWRLGNEGYTPSFYIRDSAGRRYYLKFDLPTALERNSAAERICTLIMHAAGYNVPHNSIVYFHASDLVVDEKATTRDAAGRERPMTPGDLAAAIGKLKTLPDGRFRGLASLLLPGKPVGRFAYTGLREDDPNDIIPHQRRRELRGMRVIASWINHADAGDKNTFDTYVTDDGRKFIRHYLIDFGSTLGSGNFINGPFRVGHEYIFDGPAIAKSFFTLGIWRRPWEVSGKIRYNEIGYFDAELFEPPHWKPNYPNLAFERMDDGDAYWGAKIVTAFTDGLVDQLVGAGQYSSAEVAAYLRSTLKLRRDLIGRYYLDKITPLEEFSLDGPPDSRHVRFRDLAIERSYANGATRTYRFWWEDWNGRKLTAEVTARAAEVIPPLPMKLPDPAAPADRFGRKPVARLLIQSQQRDGGWARPVAVIIGLPRDGRSAEILGWSHGVR